MRIINLTDDGLFVNRCELTDALYELSWHPKQVRPPITADALDLPRLTILYVHGWKHGTSPGDSDLKAFKELIKKLQKTYKDKKQVLGVYVSWNASNGLGDLLENISFWSKKSIADRVAQSGVVTKIIEAIGALRNQKRLDQFIAIGHSFGARIVFEATNQPLIAAAARAHPGAHPGSTDQYQFIAGAADSVILLNPAFEASIYTALDSFCRVKEAFPADQPPLLISISTDNDLATEYAFPIAQWLGLYRTPLVKTTLGNFEQYRSHLLFKDDQQHCLLGGPQAATLTESYAAGGLCLKRDTPMRWPHNPFLVAGTNSSIINGHNGIWPTKDNTLTKTKDDTFTNWIFELIKALEEASHQQLIKNRAASTGKNCPICATALGH